MGFVNWLGGFALGFAVSGLIFSRIGFQQMKLIDGYKKTINESLVQTDRAIAVAEDWRKKFEESARTC